MELALLSDDREGVGMRPWIEARSALRSEIPGMRRFATITAIPGRIERKLMCPDALSSTEH